MTGRTLSSLSLSRRSLIAGAATLAAMPAVASARSVADIAREGLQRAGSSISHRDVVGISDFTAPSRAPRFFLVDLANGRTTSHLVSHGRGSDPDHSGYVERFSNDEGSNASSAGIYRTADYYTGKHGRSQRLEGLEPGNSNAMARAIVIHGAWYVSDAMAQQHGKIGRSEGCFAFDETNGSLDEVLSRLGPGRLLYAGRFGLGV
jgi:hypothetical protein